MMVWKTKGASGAIYWSNGSPYTDPVIGKLEELPTYMQNAIAILHIAGEGKNIENIGVWQGDCYQIHTSKETP
jgi:hypothetical protein